MEEIDLQGVIQRLCVNSPIALSLWSHLAFESPAGSPLQRVQWSCSDLQCSNPTDKAWKLKYHEITVTWQRAQIPHTYSTDNIWTLLMFLFFVCLWVTSTQTQWVILYTSFTRRHTVRVHHWSSTFCHLRHVLSFRFGLLCRWGTERESKMYRRVSGLCTLLEIRFVNLVGVRQ